MENFPFLNFTPSPMSQKPSEISRSLSSKKKQIQIQFFEESPTISSRISSTPKKSRTVFINKEILRLEEELDTQEILKSQHPIKEFKDEKSRLKEMKVYEKYLDGLIYCISQMDSRIGKCFNRGWVEYRKILNKKVSKEEIVPELSESKETCEYGIQVCIEPNFEKSEKKINEYLEHFNNVIKRIDTMNHDRLIKSLKNLLKTLKAIEVPSPSSTPEMPEISYSSPNKPKLGEFQEKTEKEMEFPKIKEKTKLNINREVQTGLKASDISSWDYLKVMISERETNINILTKRVKDLEEIQVQFNNISSEFESQKKVLQEFKESGCSQCKDKIKKLEADQSEIKVLKQNITKKEHVEVELETTKTKLKESINVINKKNNKIEELTENLDELTKKIEEVRHQREKLELKLAQEESLRAKAEIQLSQEIKTNTALKTNLITQKPNLVKHSPALGTNKEEFETVMGGPLIKNSNISKKNTFENKDFKDTREGATAKELSSGPTLNYSRTRNDESPTIKTSETIAKFKVNEPLIAEMTPDIDDSSSYTNSSLQGRLIFSRENNSPASSILKRNFKSGKVNKSDKIMSALKITKEEYMSLSKKARMELFEVLFAHKEKCGNDCEHLKRAMLIKAKDKGQLFPIKKYVITKN